MKDCFSYIRFSSVGQADGTSLERQSEIAPKIAKEKGWNLRTDLNARDLGVSAYKGHNIKTMEAIIQSAKDGKLPEGVVMIIEAFDRFSRADVDTAEDLLKKVLRAGIEIYVYRGGHHLTKESLNKPIDRIIALLELAAANEYSAKLSERLKKAHQSKRNKIANGEHVKTRNFPTWVNNSDYTLNKNAQIIIRIFKSYLEGKGPGRISQELNSENIPTFSQTRREILGTVKKGKNKDRKEIWTQGFIYKLLLNRRVLGEFEVNGETVKDYLPRVIDNDTFDKVTTKFSNNRGKRPTGNDDGKIKNVFSGVAVCSCCNRPIKLMKSGKYVSCYGVVNGICKVPVVRYDAFESSFVSMLRFKSTELVQDESGNTVNNHIQILNGQLIQIQKQIETCNVAIEDCITNNRPNVLTVVEKKLSNLKSEETETQRKLELESAKKSTLSGASDRFNKILSRLDNLKSDNDLRATVQGWIRENINSVRINRSEKTYSVDFKNGVLITMNLNGEVLTCNSFVSLFTGDTLKGLSKENQTVYGK